MNQQIRFVCIPAAKQGVAFEDKHVLIFGIEGQGIVDGFVRGIWISFAGIIFGNECQVIGIEIGACAFAYHVFVFGKGFLEVRLVKNRGWIFFHGLVFCL